VELFSYTAATAKSEDEEEKGTGFGLEGVTGVEYTFSDLPNLGFAFELGISFLRLSADSSDDKLDFHFTTGGTVGVHYYFDGVR